MTNGVILRDLIDSDINIAHPDVPEIHRLTYVMFHGNEPDGAIRTSTTLRPGRVDRSSCGTVSNSNMAVRHSEGRGHRVTQSYRGR